MSPERCRGLKERHRGSDLAECHTLSVQQTVPTIGKDNDRYRSLLIDTGVDLTELTAVILTGQRRSSQRSTPGCLRLTKGRAMSQSLPLPRGPPFPLPFLPLGPFIGGIGTSISSLGISCSFWRKSFSSVWAMRTTSSPGLLYT